MRPIRWEETTRAFVKALPKDELVEDAFDLNMREGDQGHMEEVGEDRGGLFIIAALQGNVWEKL